MIEQNNEQKQNNFLSSNEAALMNTSFMEMRLNTNSLIDDIKNFLESREQSTIIKDGVPTIKIDQIGLPLASPEGIMRLCNIVKMRVNHHVSQGNIDDEHYWDFIARARKEITETVIKKCYDWEIEDTNLNMVIDEISALIEIFLTRPIGNLEREGFAATIKESSSIVQNEKQRGGGLSSYGGGFGGA